MSLDSRLNAVECIVHCTVIFINFISKRAHSVYLFFFFRFHFWRFSYSISLCFIAALNKEIFLVSIENRLSFILFFRHQTYFDFGIGFQFSSLMCNVNTHEWIHFQRRCNSNHNDNEKKKKRFCFVFLFFLFFTSRHRLSFYPKWMNGKDGHQKFLFYFYFLSGMRFKWHMHKCLW